jgi:ParB-like chromosome segregation protein Spo0J
MDTTFTTSTTTREISIDRLVIDPEFASLYIEDPPVIERITRSMRQHGFDPHRPIDVWKDGAGRGRHVVMEGHQRLIAAQRAGLTTVRVAFRHPADKDAGLLWAAEQQINRRNSPREAQCLSLLRALERNGTLEGTRAQLAERFGFGDATVGRALQVLRRGTESEIIAVLEGTHSLKTAYELILKRERGETVKEPQERQPAPEPEPDLEPEPLEDDNVPEELQRARDVLHDVVGRVGRLEDILLAETVADILDDVRDGRTKAAIDELAGLLEDLRAAVDALSEMEPVA